MVGQLSHGYAKTTGASFRHFVPTFDCTLDDRHAGPAEEPSAPEEPRKGAAETPTTEEPRAEPAKPRWHYGAYLDLSYPVDFNFPENHRWRSKVTTQRVNELTPNMALGYVRKDVDESSRWGMEFAVQGGYNVTGQVPNASVRYGDPYSNADTFSHFSRANVSYLAPVGTGLKLTAGLFNSFIGYESFYAKDNFNYTRSYLPDYSPYFMFGLSAQYQINEAVKSVFYIINRFNFLSVPNHLPSYGTQVSWAASPRITLTQNLYYGPDQSNTSTFGIGASFPTAASNGSRIISPSHSSMTSARSARYQKPEASGSSGPALRSIPIGSLLRHGRWPSGPSCIMTRTGQ